MTELLTKSLPFVGAFLGALVLTLILTPIVREMNRRLGMVDKPDPRRINKVPIPRGGGLALVLGVFVSYSLFIAFTGRPALQADEVVSNALYWKLVTLGGFLALIGYADDKFSLPPKLKLLGQLLVAVLAWGWADLGFHRLWPSLPAWIDCAFTVFWITGAINAFNLIDGLDGLASGIALIATLGMAAATALTHNPQCVLFHLAFAGGLLGFLRYNYNPASIFLGDCGSMFVGFIVSILPLISQTADSFLVSVGVPLLAMGVPVFDTSLAIVRRIIRGIINRRDDTNVGNGKMMTADADHLHHRILRSVNSNQRKAAWIIYSIALFLVIIGLLNLLYSAHRAVIWVVAVAIIGSLIFKEMSQIELYDAGRLLNEVAHNPRPSRRSRWTRFATPFYILGDVAVIFVSYLICCTAFNVPLTRDLFYYCLPTRMLCILLTMAVFGIYRIVWARAIIFNYLILFVTSLLGTALGMSLLAYMDKLQNNFITANFFFFLLVFAGFMLMRFMRGLARDFFYAIDYAHMKAQRCADRVLVYGSGLRYRSFRRELVRHYESNNRMIVGFLDDNIYLRGKRIGSTKVYGTINEAPRVIEKLKVDVVVITCKITPEWEKVVKEILEPTGVRVLRFDFVENELLKGKKQ